MPIERVSVVGSSGSGKTTLARRIADALDLAFVELDALFHLPDWEQRPDDEFRAAVSEACPADGRWVVDGNDRRVTMDGPVWDRADTVVVLDLPRHRVMRQIIGRTVRRSITRQQLWNGNREPLGNFLRWDPERNVIRWSWVHHHAYTERHRTAADDPRWAHLDFVFVKSHAEADAWLDSLTPD